MEASERGALLAMASAHATYAPGSTARSAVADAIVDALPRLLSDLDAASARAAELEAALAALVVDHHPPVTDRGDCYYCGLPAGHTSDCPWERARAALAWERDMVGGSAGPSPTTSGEGEAGR